MKSFGSEGILFPVYFIMLALAVYLNVFTGSGLDIANIIINIGMFLIVGGIILYSTTHCFMPANRMMASLHLAARNFQTDFKRKGDYLWDDYKDNPKLFGNKLADTRFREYCEERRRLTMLERSAQCDIDDYLNDVVKKHELTREDKEQDRIRHVDVCDANTGPIYLACKYPQELLDLMENWKASHDAVYDFVAEDEIGHRVWVIDGEAEKKLIKEQFGNIPSVYIADGHHRAASAVKVGLKRRQEHPDYDGSEEFNYFLSVVFPYDQLTILSYNRVVRDLNGMDEHAFVASLKFNFELMIMPGFPCKPVEKHCMGMYVGGNWYHLKAWEDVYAKKDVVGQLDVSILQEKVLSPILGIRDPRTDERIRFVGGSHKLRELAEIADKTDGVAFAMYPTSMEDLMQIADEGKLMPPKSTWFEPKLRSGLFIHKLS